MVCFKLLLLVLLLSVNVWSNTVFDNASKKYGISVKLLASIAYEESDFNMNVVGVTIKKPYILKIFKKCINIIGCKISFNAHRAKVYPMSIAQAKLVFLALNRLHLNYDVGLMQINSYNIKKMKLNELKLLQDIRYNINTGARIYKSCYDRFENLSASLECYNMGYNSNLFNDHYYNAVINKYHTLFN